MLSQRYNGIVDNFHTHTYHILGCGAIGSAAATQLVRMGALKLKLYDRDEVNNENLGVSMFRIADIGMSKPKALMSICLTINNNVNIECIEGDFENYMPEGNDIVILGFDSMKSRKEAVESILKLKKPKYLIDGRMGAEHYQQYVFDNPTLSQYLKTWYSDEEGSQEPCNAKATSYCSNMSGSFIANTIRKLLKEQPFNKEISFHFPTMMLEVK
jgi:molybdopterin/thiamine biosynthesis adenylyltransferase|tara:strand:- start:31 stop:672 length:642 start_codon:yes stop_codon:yes gene_type:complete